MRYARSTNGLMNLNTRPPRRRAGPLFGAFLLVVTAALAFTPIVPSAGAIDPTPSPVVETPAPSDSPAPSADPTPTVTLDPTPAPPPDPTPVPAPDPTPTPTPDPSPDPSPSPTPAPTPAPTTSAVRGSLSLSADAPGVGRRRVDPSSVVTVTLSARVLDDAKDVSLVTTVPPGWAVVGAGAAPATFAEGNLDAGASVTETVRLRAPSRSPEGRPAFDAVLSAQLVGADGVIDTAAISLRVAPEIVVEHVTFARIADVTHEATYLDPNAPLDGVGRYDRFRIRFQVRNADLVAVSLSPTLQWSTAGSMAFADVPTGGSEPGQPFYVGHEWRPVPGGGTLPGPDREAIAAADVRVHDKDDEAQLPASGEHLMGTKQAPAITLEGDSYTEVEFTVRVTSAVELGQAYAFRLVDKDRSIVGAAVAQVVAASQPALTVSPGQRDGVPVGPPVDATPPPVSVMDAPRVTAAFTGAAWPESGATPRYRLAVAVPTTPATQYPLYAGAFTSPHTPDGSLVSDTCAICHRAHVAQGPNLLAQPAPQASMCFTCHDDASSGSDLNTEVQFPVGTLENSAGTVGVTRSEYFRHDATSTSAPIPHTLAQDDEFGGVLNRHSECADCHNSHNATPTASVQWSDGWSVSGRQAATSGVSVVNGPAGSVPTYTFLNGTAGSQPTREYEICFKCHSGFTTLPATDGTFPSTWALDKAIELNPGDASSNTDGSYHPVEAAGKNRTAQMAASLSGSSPYKQWNFRVDGTVRCVNCHGNPRTLTYGTPPLSGVDATTATGAGRDLAPHSSQFRGLLVQNYRDRVLKPQGEAYAAADFALCFVCHAEKGFVTSSTSGDTNFFPEGHDKHLTGIGGDGDNPSTSIDVDGAGQGNAICSECHFRTHGTALAFSDGDKNNSRLVNFAPNIQPSGGVIRFTKIGDGGSCTLICHGKNHSPKTY
jgi:predicted CXXCH cytochrome family protein